MKRSSQPLLSSIASVTRLEALEARRLLHADHAIDDIDHLHAAAGDEKHPEENCSPCLVQTPSSEYNLGSKWSSSTVSYGYSNLFGSLTSDMTNREIRDAINEALLVWSAVSPLRFIETSDPGGTINDNSHSVESPQIRIGAHYIDGNSGSNVLAHAYYPGSGRGGDLHFDTGNTYNRVNAEYFTETAAHEIGHAIGLDHANGDVSGGTCPSPKPAIMDACIQGRYGEPGDAYLLSDDISGVQAHYGAGLGYVLESSGALYVQGTQGNNRFDISVDGNNLTVSSEGFGSFTRSLTGITSITVYGRGGNDTFWVYDVPSSIELELNGAAGNDVVQIGDGDFDSNILGNVITNLGDGTDEVVVNDILDGFGSDTHVFDLGFHFHKLFGGDINFNGNIESFSLLGSGNNDTINVLQVPVGVNFTLNGWGGDDVINIGNDDFDFWVGGNISVTGFSGNDTLNILDSGDAGADTHTLDNNSYSKSSEPNTVQYTTIETVNLVAASGNYANIFNLNGGPTNGVVNVAAGDGDDVFNVGGNNINANAVNTVFNLDGQAGSDELNYNDASDTGDADVYTINNSQIRKVGGGVTTDVNLLSIASQVINASQGGTLINGLGIGRQTTINAGAGDDIIDLDDNYTLTLLPGNITIQYATAVNTGTGADNVLLNDDGTGNLVWASFDQSETLGSLIIGAGGLLNMLPNGLRHLSVTGVTLAGRLNLNDNMLIRRDWGLTGQGYYQTRLRNGYNNGAWNGAEPAIFSSTAAANPNYALGYALKSAAPGVIALGTVLNPDDLLIRLTQKGDTDLDRDVDFDDLLKLAQNYGVNTNRIWSSGDSDYDGDVDFDDLLAQAQRYGQPFLVASSVSSSRTSLFSSLEADALI